VDLAVNLVFLQLRNSLVDCARVVQKTWQVFWFAKKKILNFEFQVFCGRHHKWGRFGLILVKVIRPWVPTT